MIRIVIGAVMVAIAVGVILALQKPEDKYERAPQVTLKQVLLSNVLLVLIMAGGTLIALGVFE